MRNVRWSGLFFVTLQIELGVRNDRMNYIIG